MGTHDQNGKEAVENGAHVKAYLVQKFDTGCRSGQKADPVQVAREKKIVKDDAGHLLFTRQEWRRAQQINSFSSRLSAVQRQTQMEKDTSEYSTSQEFSEEDPDLEALENEITLENLRIAVNLQVTAPQHPIVVRNRNLCELSKARKPNKLKVAELREILQLEVSGSLARKKLFIEPLETYVKCFTCFTRVENKR